MREGRQGKTVETAFFCSQWALWRNGSLPAPLPPFLPPSLLPQSGLVQLRVLGFSLELAYMLALFCWRLTWGTLPGHTDRSAQAHSPILILWSVQNSSLAGLFGWQDFLCLFFSISKRVVLDMWIVPLVVGSVLYFRFRRSVSQMASCRSLIVPD